MKKLLHTLILLGALCAAAPLWAGIHSQMRSGICDHNLSKVKALIRRGYNINRPMGKTSSGDSEKYPLELASYCYGGSAAIASYLIDQGANVNLHSGDYSPLMWALRSTASETDGDMQRVVLKMIQRGARANYQDKTTGRTPLMIAASHGNTKVVRLLLQRGATNAPRTKDDWCISGDANIKCTASMLARLGGHVLLALELEGKPTASYKKGLNYAIIKGKQRRVADLIQNGADVNQAEELSRMTPLHYAIKHKRKKIAEMLLKAGADPNARQLLGGITPLRDAVVTYQTDMSKLLIQYGAKANHRQTSGCGGGQSEFDWAISYTQPKIAAFMIQHGAVSLTQPTGYGSDGLLNKLYGREKFHVDLVNEMIQRGYRATEADLDWLKKIYQNNSWMQKRPQATYHAKILAALKRSMKRKPIKPVVVRPNPQKEELNIEVINPWAVKSRSGFVDPDRIEGFNQRYKTGTNPKAALDPSAERLP